MKSKLYLILLSCIYIGASSNQLLASSLYDTIYFEATNDKYKQVNSVIKDAKNNTVLFFDKGNYLFEESIILKSNIQIVGADREAVVFEYKGNKPTDFIIIHGKSQSRELANINVTSTSQRTMQLSELGDLKPGDLIKVYEPSSAKMTSDWAKDSYGQLLFIDSLKPIQKQLRTQQLCRIVANAGAVLKIERILPIVNVHFKNITLIRQDATTNQTSTVDVNHAFSCSFLNVKFINCNYAHIAVSNSLQVLINDCEFEKAFNYGNGGKGYGVALQYAATDCIVKNSIFDNLRHPIVLQAGANGCKILGNYCLNSHWDDVRLPKAASGDIVLHGNYPHNNWFEGNICNNIVIDNSHGKNGGGNVFYKNRTLLYGFYVNNNAVDGVVTLLANDVEHKSCMKGKVKGSAKQLMLVNNRKNGKAYKNQAEIPADDLLYRQLIGVSYQIGKPNDFNNFTNLAYERYSRKQIK